MFSSHLPLFARLRYIVLLLLLPVVMLSGAFFQSETAVAQTSVVEFTIGQSGQGRPITAVKIGNGPHKLVIVGDTHGGPEANTYQLTTQLIAYFRANPGQVPAGVRLYLIPTLNPDGLALGTRFNGNFVDLNRNMNTNLDACTENDWTPRVQGAYGVVSDTGGPYPDSEVESRLIRSFLLDASGAIFIHSNAGLVFPAFCEHQPSIEMGKVYAEAAGYVYNRYWPNYLITGGMHDWAGSLGIAAITPELVTGDQSEYDQNLAGVLAVLGAADRILVTPEDHVEGGVAVPALIWRFWKAYGGEAAFGLPLEEAVQGPDGPSQIFAKATLEVHLSAADTPQIVQVAPLGRALTAGTTFAPGAPADAVRFFNETDHTLRESFLYYWERYSGDQTLGLPISEEFTTRTVDGKLRIVQFFERGALAYYPEFADTAQAVQPEPLGWIALQRRNVLAPWVGPQVR